MSVRGANVLTTGMPIRFVACVHLVVQVDLDNIVDLLVDILVVGPR